MTRCKSYFRGRGVLVLHGKRCELDAGHNGQHRCAGSFLDPRAYHRWGRKKGPLFEFAGGHWPSGQTKIDKEGTHA